MDRDANEPDQLHEAGVPWPVATSAGPQSAPLLEECFECAAVPPEVMDALWAEAWRHFGPLFVRYSMYFGDELPLLVQPLRVVLAQFVLSHSHRRILRRNADLEVRCQPPRLDVEREDLFHRHKRRFRRHVPDSLDQFLGPAPGVVPGEMIEVAAYRNDRLVAASYLDVGREGVSSLYGMFDPAFSRRSLGIATMLWELAYARDRGCRFYYPGYAYHSPSPLDYKKQFAGCEWFDWQGHWLPLPK